MRYGEDIINEVSEYITDAGFDITFYEDQNGCGREYVLENDEGSLLMQEHEFRDFCQSILTEINTAKLEITIKHVQHHFKPFLGSSAEKPDLVFEVSPEEQTLIEKCRKLDDDGKIMLQSTIISELRRIK